MRIQLRNLSILLVFVCLRPGFASDGDYSRLTERGLDLAYNLHFDEATSIFQTLIQIEPDNPRGYLLQAVNYYYRYQLEENQEYLAKKFIDASNEAISRAQKQVGSKKNKLDALFYLGTTYTYLAAYHGWESNWLRAYWYGRDGIQYLERVVAIDPTYYDAYLGLGLYHYYTDVLPSFAKAVTFLLGIDANRDRGLAELELAAEQGKYSRAEALLFLGSIYLYIEKDYAKSQAYLEQLSDLYPENSSYLMLLGECYQKLGKNDLAANTLHRLVNDSTAAQYPVLMVSSYFRLGNLYYNERELPSAIRYYQSSLDYAYRSTGNVKWAFALSNLNLGRSYDLLGQRKVAMQYYAKVKKSDHKHAYEIAQKRMKKPLQRSERGPANRNFDEIIEIYQDAIAQSRNPDGSISREKSAEINFNVAKALYERGAYQSAYAKLKRVLATNENNPGWVRPWALYYLGRCYLEFGNSDEAIDAFERAYMFADDQLRLEIESTRALMTSSETPASN